MSGRVFGVALAVLVLAAPRAFACKCTPPPPPAEIVAAHALVFVGRAISGTFLGDDITAQKPYGREFVFRVGEVLKGDDEVRRVTIYTGAGGGDCGFDFVVGNEYLVYARESGGRFETGLCDYTKEYLPEGRSEAATIRGLRPSTPK